MATANPTHFYEKVLEEEALSRNARQYPGYPPQPGYPVVPYPGVAVGPQPGCEQKCHWSYFQQRQICDWWCPRM